MDRKNNITYIMLNTYYDCMSYSFLEYCGYGLSRVNFLTWYCDYSCRGIKVF